MEALLSSLTVFTNALVLQAQVEKMEAASAEKDAEYEAIVKKSEGGVI